MPLIFDFFFHGAFIQIEIFLKIFEDFRFFCSQFILIEIISNIFRIKYDILGVYFYLYNVGSDYFGRTVHYWGSIGTL